MPTKVIHIRSWDKTNPDHVYAGRAGKGQKDICGNPVSKGSVCVVCHQIHVDGESTLPCFTLYFNERIAQDEVYKNTIDDLKDKTLVCFCKPKDGFQGRVICHAQIVAAYLDGCNPNEVP